MPQNDDLIQKMQELLVKERDETRKMVREEVEAEGKAIRSDGAKERIRIITQLDKINDKVKDQTIAITRLEGKVGNLEEGQKKLEDGLARVETKLDKEIEAIGVMNKALLDVLEDRFDKVDKRIDRLEEEVGIPSTP
jgi:hypothetical protein